ncbi:MAG: DUF308 domain-containing protein [Bifidobacteriaceae bacterium]|jgi:uncharacterized membrane protein HdeD (DUF308 family)|nr:DUF308 domain-containing protein [Bifidobacteriaceae bacterium]
MTATEQKPVSQAETDEAYGARIGVPFPGLHLSRRFAGRLRVWLVLRGLLGLVVGGLILFRPDLSVDAFALLIGIFFVVVGVARIVVGAADSEFTTGVRVLNVVFGLLLVVLGAIAIRYPGLGVFATMIMIGFAWMMEGGATLAVLPPKHQGRGWAIAFAVLSLVAGAVVVLWPLESLLPLMIVAGAFLVAGGIVDLVNAALLKPADRPR